MIKINSMVLKNQLIMIEKSIVFNIKNIPRKQRKKYIQLLRHLNFWLEKIRLLKAMITR